MKLRGFADGHCDPFLEERTAVGIAQLDVVVPASKREFLGLLDLIRVAAIDVNCSVLAVRFDLYVAEVRCHVVQRVRIRYGYEKNGSKTWTGSTITTRGLARRADAVGAKLS